METGITLMQHPRQYQAGEDWYYMRGGCVVTGSNTIDGNQYYFDSNGVWVF